jgi:predicted unusual protein kinase regulating ubiquinone biosynthesis (AarF/ABC1/UbiB family)
MQTTAEVTGPRLRLAAASGKLMEKQEDDDGMAEEKMRGKTLMTSTSRAALPGMKRVGILRRCELFMRSLAVFWTAGRLFLDYKILQWRTNQMTAEQEELSDQLWESAHSRNAAFLYRQFVSLEGLWLKLGQFLSSRADVMPSKYVEILSKCQDSLPPRPFAQVRAQLEEDLGMALEEVFDFFDEAPIACASIAQVP